MKELFGCGSLQDGGDGGLVLSAYQWVLGEPDLWLAVNSDGCFGLYVPGWSWVLRAFCGHTAYDSLRVRSFPLVRFSVSPWRSWPGFFSPPDKLHKLWSSRSDYPICHFIYGWMRFLGFFLLLLGVAGAGNSTFAAGYFRSGEGTAPALLGMHYHIFLASMAVVMLADDAYLFMVAWETMALSSYFLVTSHHRSPEIRKAGFLYLIMAHVGAICILLSFGVLQGGTWQFTFDAMRGAPLTPFWATTAFLLSLVGFGAKAGLVPMHVWLPEAHPAAPSPVSAMMSGIMLKTAIYGILRITFDLLHIRFWQWGVLLVGMGLFSALFGAIFAAVQTDMKRLLAYSSIENIGLIFAGIGLSILFATSNMPLFAALALTAALVHSLNHSLFKSLLFLATGSVLHATRQRSLGNSAA